MSLDFSGDPLHWLTDSWYINIAPMDLEILWPAGPTGKAIFFVSLDRDFYVDIRVLVLDRCSWTKNRHASTIHESSSYSSCLHHSIINLLYHSLMFVLSLWLNSCNRLLIIGSSVSFLVFRMHRSFFVITFFFPLHYLIAIIFCWKG